MEFKFRVKDFVEASEVEHAPDDGIYVFGLFIEGAKWAFEAQSLEEQ